MTFATLMVGLQAGRSNRAALAVTGDLAERCSSGVVGVAACRPIEVVCFDYSVPAKLFDEDRKQAARDLQAAETEFRAALQGRTNRLEWRAGTTTSPLAEHLASQGRIADLIIVGSGGKGAPPDNTRHIDLCDLVMQAGRPVLVVPEAAESGKLDRVVVGWKDARESRRAIVDALPLLARAKEVTVAAVTTEAEVSEIRTELEQVVEWLGRHGVSAKALAVTSRGSHASELGAIANDRHADLVVAGAYGYSRQREWVLGGVTADLLQHPQRCALLSH